MENVTDTPVLAKKGTFPAKVANIFPDKCKLVINKGKEDGIRLAQRMLVYTVSDEEILDPNTGESLGHLEIVKGTGKIINIQDRISTLESDKIQSIKRTLTPNNRPPYIPGYGFLGEQIVEETYPIPFENPQVGDLVKPI